MIFISLGSEAQATPPYTRTYYDTIGNEYQRPVYEDSSSDYQHLAVYYDDLEGDFVIVTGVFYYYVAETGSGPYTTYVIISEGLGLDYMLYVDSNIPNLGSIPSRRGFGFAGPTYLIDDDPSVGIWSPNPSTNCLSLCGDSPSTGNSGFDNGTGTYYEDPDCEYLVELRYEPVVALTEGSMATGSITMTDVVDAYYVNLTSGVEYQFAMDNIFETGTLSMRLCANQSLTNLELESSFGTGDFFLNYTPSTTDTYILLVEPNQPGVDITDYSIEFSSVEPEELDVDFTANATLVSEGQWIEFTYNGSGGVPPLNYMWDFGDGNNSTDASPSHQYTTLGSHTVNLTITDDNGVVDYEEKVDYITVELDTQPYVDFTINTTTISLLEWVRFEHTGSGGNVPLNYLWEFGDGDISTEENATHQYTTGGNFTITLTVTDRDGDSDMAVNYIYVNLVPTADFIANTTIINEGQWIEFTFTGFEGNTPMNYFWSFGDGGTSTDSNPTYQYTEAGNYTVSLTITDFDGESRTETKIDYILVVTPEEESVPGYELLLMFGIIGVVSIISIYKAKKRYKS